MSGDDTAYDQQFGVKYRPAEAILRHPRFPQARATYVDSVMTLYGEDAFLNKLLMEAVRIVIFSVAICLDAAYREEDRGTWPTVANLKKALAMFGLASPRRIEQVTARLVQTGFLESRVSPIDRRARLLVPTARMIDHDCQWLMAHYAPLAEMFGPDDFALPLSGDLRFQQVQRRVATDFFPQSAAVLLRNPDMMLFLARDAGVFVLVSLVQDSLERGTTEVPLSLSTLGTRFGVSRTHVRQLLGTASEQGLVTIDPSRRTIGLSPRLLASLDRFIADSMSNHDLTGAAARKELALA